MRNKRKPAKQDKRKGARYETCRECGLVWNISIKAEVPLNGYLCPRCRSKLQGGTL